MWCNRRKGVLELGLGSLLHTETRTPRCTRPYTCTHAHTCISEVCIPQILKDLCFHSRLRHRSLEDFAIWFNRIGTFETLSLYFLKNRLWYYKDYTCPKRLQMVLLNDSRMEKRILKDRSVPIKYTSKRFLEVGAVETSHPQQFQVEFLLLLNAYLWPLMFWFFSGVSGT